MTEKDFIDAFKDALGIDQNLTMDTDLNDVERWDSLGAVSFIEMCEKNTGKSIFLGSVISCNTVRDLYQLIK